ncbi:MAG: hypothetical protein ACJ73E_00935 [Mycobacteriales bacterium]
MTDPRPDPGSEAAGEPEYGNDTGFAAAADPDDLPAQPAAGEDSDDDPGRGAD